MHYPLLQYCITLTITAFSRKRGNGCSLLKIYYSRIYLLGTLQVKDQKNEFFYLRKPKIKASFQENILTFTWGIRLPICTYQVTSFDVIAAHASFCRLIVADHDYPIHFKSACSQTYAFTFYVCNFVTRRFWNFIYFNGVMIFEAANNVHNQHQNCKCRS